jgi:GPH family glycoside/pentoside/hexuronide:cation symporter
MEKIKSTLKEKLYYGFGNMGVYIMWSFVSVYVTVYASNCLNLSATYLSIFATVILVCRFFDGASDIVMGIIIEKTDTKLGKARFWYGISIIPLTICFFFVFFLSGLDMTVSLVMISILYFLFTVVFYTMNSIAFNAELPTISEDPYDQSNVCTINSIFTSVGSLVGAFTLPILAAFAGTEDGTTSQKAWSYFGLILALIALVGQILSFINVKEKKEIKCKAKEKLSKSELKQGMLALLKSKYFYIAIAMFLINYYLSLSVSTVGSYYAIYVLGNKWYSTMFGSLPMITMGVGLLATPFLVKKIGKKNTLTAAITCVFLGNVIGSIAPYNFGVGITGAMIKGLGSAIVMSQLYTLAPDMVRYIQLKTGLRVEGMAASANSVGSKIGSGLGSAFVLWSLAWFGFNKDAGTNQVASATYSFIALYWWIPAVLSLILLGLSLLWDINKKSEMMEKARLVPADTSINK